MTKPKAKNPEMSTERLIFFSDGVFAIAITLLILEIKIPTHEQLLHAGGLYHYLLGIWPSYLSYIISFFVIGIYWSNHHWLFSFIIKKTNHILNMLHILFLMTVAFIPFSTAVFSEFVLEEEYRSAAVSAYAFGYLLPIPSVILLFLYARHKKHLIDKTLSDAYMNKQVMKLFASLAFTSISFLLSFNHPLISVCLIAGSFVLYFIPPDAPVYMDGHEANDNATHQH